MKFQTSVSDEEVSPKFFCGMFTSYAKQSSKPLSAFLTQQLDIRRAGVRPTGWLYAHQRAMM